MLFGAHVSAAGGISKAIDRVEEIGGNAVQVFTQSPRMWRPTAHTPEEVARFRTRRRQARVQAVTCHALYLVNLASRDAAVRENSLAALRATMETADAIGAEAVVFHVGSHLGFGFDEAVALVEPALRELLELTTDDLWLCMENAAGAGGTIGRSIAELAALATRSIAIRGSASASTRATGGRRASTCPTRRRSTRRSANSTCSIGLDRLRVLHVNDSQTALGSNRDRHELVGKGSSATASRRSSATPRSPGCPRSPRRGRTRAARREDLDRMRNLRRRGQSRWRRRSAASSRLVRDGREDAERRALARKLVELGDAASELVLAVRVRAHDLDLAHRQRRPARADGAEARPARLGLLEQVEVDLDVVDLLHAPDVRVAPRLVRVDERAGHAEARGGVDDLLAVDVAVAAGHLVLDPERELDPC